ncbi:MAG: ribonuclease Z [Saprospiraceae bacterium]|nr:ribonuclease Z [Saprospiraceae bacterium]
MQKEKKNSIPFDLLILGSSSAIPSDSRFPSAQVIRMGEDLFLIDCGEASQNRLWAHRVKWNKIGWILISHMHGDHVYGLPGLITSFCHLQRENPLKIAGPRGIKDYLHNIFYHSQVKPCFEIEFIELDQKPSIVMDEEWRSIQAFPLDHRIPTMGYQLKIHKQIRRLNMDKLDQLSIALEDYQRIIIGESVCDSEGRVYHADELTFTEEFRRSYAYCSDTRYMESLIPKLHGTDVLYHETTYLDDLADKAHQTGHTTARQAAEFAKKAEVGQLITGHYSSRYKDLQVILDECRTIFPNTILGKEGLRMEIRSSSFSVI